MSAADAKYRAIFNLANDAIFLHDAATGAILDVNQRASEMYGWTREEAVRMTVADLSAGDPLQTQASARDRLARAAAGTGQIFEWLAKGRTGRTFWVEVNLKRGRIGGRDQLLAIVRDIGER
jgi:PAS domain S-box-containing protein